MLKWWLRNGVLRNKQIPQGGLAPAINYRECQFPFCDVD